MHVSVVELSVNLARFGLTEGDLLLDVVEYACISLCILSHSPRSGLYPFLKNVPQNVPFFYLSP